MATDKVCVVTGVGPGTGTALARRFADDGYRVALLARNTARLDALAAELPGSKACSVDIADLDALKQTLASIRTDLGEPEVLLHNAVSGGFGTFDTVDPADLEQRFRVNVTSLLVMAQELAPAAAPSSPPATRRHGAARPRSPASHRPRPRSASSANRSRALSGPRACTSPTWSSMP
jgi:NAD(P)-dependent dehydrogenase (short-subunit alcohol dehydrogenase family)